MEKKKLNTFMQEKLSFSILMKKKGYKNEIKQKRAAAQTQTADFLDFSLIL